MKRILLATFFVMVLAPAAWAQVPFVPSFEFGVGGGLNLPLGDIGDGMNNGYSFNASVGYNVAPMFIIGAEFGFFGSSASDQTLALLGTGSEFSLSSVQFTAMAKYKFPMAVHHMYAKALAGGYRLATDLTSPLGTFDISSTNFGMGIGGGFQFNGFKNSSIYTEGIYHRVSGASADGEFVTLNLGMMFSFN
ncbi:MAG: outer membrane beta-barrel protein [Candidatus Krumholzibacteria bacterium]